MESTNKKTWYKTNWDIILILSLWPIFLSYWIWKRNWELKIKLGYIVVIWIIIIAAVPYQFLDTKKSNSTEDQLPINPTITPGFTLTPSNTLNSYPTKTSIEESSETPKPTLNILPKQISFSAFKKFFVENYSYRTFIQSVKTSDNWDFYESNNNYGDKLMLATIGEDLKSGILQTGPNDTSPVQLVTFFTIGYPPAINSGWVEKAVSDIEEGGTKETILQGVKVSIMMPSKNVWIASFVEQ